MLSHFMVSKLLRLVKNAPPIQQAVLEIQRYIAQLRCEKLSSIVEDLLTDTSLPNILENLKLTIPLRYSKFDNAAANERHLLLAPRQDIEKPLRKAILIAPGSCRNHHIYPGGLIIHTVLNLWAIDRLKKIYRLSRLEYETLITAHIVHDLFKGDLLIWRRDGLPLAEPRISGTGAHHVLCLAYLFLLKAPRQLLRTVASIHTHPYNEPNKAAEFLVAGARLVGLSQAEATAMMAELLHRSRLDMIAYLGERFWWEYSIFAEHVAREFMFKAVKTGRLGADWPPPNVPEHRWAQNFILTILTEYNFFRYLKKSKNKTLQRLRDAEKTLRELGLWPVSIVA